MEGREGRGGSGEESARRTVPGRSRNPVVWRLKKMKHLKHVFETLAKTPENT
jgi:hypothetical protein